MLYSWDVETARWDTYVLSVAYSVESGPIVLRSREALRRWYLSTDKNDRIVTYNGGRFDLICLIETLPELEWTATMAGASVITCQAEGHAVCIDLARLFPGGLDDWTGRKTATGLECECGRRCGGYCAIKVNMPRDKRERLAEYCANDARITLETYLSDLARLESDGFITTGKRGEPILTVGAMGWATAAALAGLDTRPIGRHEYIAARAAYFGGNCQVGATRADVLYRFDRHACYPASLTEDVPDGSARTLRGDAARHALAMGVPGAYRARVFVPESELPPLPHRYAGRARGILTRDRLVWANGILDGVWTDVELRYAIEERGVRVLAWGPARVYEKRATLYRYFVEHCYSVRDRATAAKDKRYAKRIKWIMNSLTGKLAQRPTRRSLRILPEGDDGAELMLKGWGRIAGRVWASPEISRIPSCARPIHAATLTSRARVALHTRLARHEGRWAYCDTDSTYLLEYDPIDVHASALGLWGYEGEARLWLCPAPKLYRYCDEYNEWHVRARGIPRATYDDFDTLLSGHKVIKERGVLTLRQGGGAFKRRVLERGLRADPRARSIAGTRLVLADGRTWPLTRSEDGSYGYSRSFEAGSFSE